MSAKESDLLPASSKKSRFWLKGILAFLTAPFRYFGRYLAKKWRLMFVTEGQVVQDAIPFQVGIDTIIAEHPPFLMMSVFYLIIGAFISAIVIASVVQIEIIVVGQGRLTTLTPPLQIQHMDRAILRELKVKAGDEVIKGQILATFDATFAHADLKSLLGQQQATLVKIRRLEHEFNHTPFDIGNTPNADEQLQSVLLAQRQAQYASRLNVYDEEIQRIEASIRSTKDERVSLKTLLEISKDVEKMRESLKKSGTGSQLQYQDSQVVRIRTEQSVQDAANRLIESQHYLDAKKAERQNFKDEWARQLLDTLIAARSEADKINELVIKAQRISDMEVMTAPVDGVILDVAKRATGSVLNAAELLITLVPKDSTLIAEIMIGSMDVGYVQPGDKVIIKVSAFPYQRHGMLEGRLLYVSQESFAGGFSSGSGDGSATERSASGAYHVGRVELTKTDLEHLPRGGRLIRGMTVAADIKVGKRKLIGYFLDSLVSMMDSSMRER